MFSFMLDALNQCLIFLPMILGVYFTYSILNITDMTVGGSYVLGAAIYARLMSQPIFSSISPGSYECLITLLGIAGGVLAGLSVFALQRFAKLDALVASILAVFMLFSINFGIMNQPNISLLTYTTPVSTLQNLGPVYFNGALLLLCLILMIILFILLKSPLGLRLRAYGTNPILLKKLGFKASFYLAFGLMLSNGLAALCGIINAQINGYADIHTGDGIAFTAIGAVVIGAQLIKSLKTRLFPYLKNHAKNDLFHPLSDLLGSCLGAFVYFLALHLFLILNINPIYMQFFLGLILALFLSSAHYSRDRSLEYDRYQS